ncbi:DUF427 domain-containing protein [Synechococcus sp. BA-132 BA5]|uniref:DUF427 domain-containing protein n=1 Tax=Synechococcus sp. BA-132 BA5 TaxID=3110252 RepID=UPI002B2114A1|nr:DUF427 domain-containing protein [Synechococcus sp. BA-132 BA5]MEA5414082.1 DUF427 domain-containing protein [Synechococcus sp. BA-132 BA5]
MDPPSSVTPLPWQRSGLPERVADYPRPPALALCTRHVRLEVLGRLLADSHRSLRVLETFHPPTFYLPGEALDLSLLQPAGGRSFCEWKGVACYFDLVAPGPDGMPRRLKRALWQYPDPTPAFAALAGWYSLYPALMDGCWLDGEPVTGQPGGFYGGWITSDVEGPFKGDPRHPELV